MGSNGHGVAGAAGALTHNVARVALPEAPIPGATDLTANLQRLAQVAVSSPIRRGRRLLERLRTPEQRIDAAYRRLALASPDVVEMSRGAEWLLDNQHIIRRALRLLHEEFPRDFERRLPILTTGELHDLPRVYALAKEIALASAGPVDLHAAIPLLHDFQAAQPLTIAEGWALPVVLRLVLLERLGAAVDGMVPEGLSDRRADIVSQRAMDDVVATSVRSLRILESTDWKDFVEEISVVERTLSEDPARVYTRMDFETRDRYRKAVEELASRSSYAETAVAAEAVRLARANRAEPFTHVGYHLIGPGHDQFERLLGYRPRWPIRLRRLLVRHPTTTYVGSIVSLTMIAESLLLARLLAAGTSPLIVCVALLLAAVPAVTVAISLANGAITRILPPSVLPKMAFKDGIPPEFRTLVAVPALLTSAEEVATLMRQLEIRFLANQHDNLHFSLLTDFGDAPTATLPGDADLLQLAEDGIRALNVRYGTRGNRPFHLLHRPRTWSPTEGCWMGWERKRGKLSELNELLRGEPRHGFETHVGDAGALRSVRFVITLDADTQLPRGAAVRLVGALAHPLNRAQFSRSGVVRSGYTVLQPRIEISPLSAGASRFAALFAGGDALDPYSRAVSDVYQDLFGEGVYTGKGIYDVQAFTRCLAGRVPEGALLSHDLFEGVHGRAGLVSDVVLIEDYPSHYLAYTRRLHRWARGDWQLLPWLRRHVPDAQHRRIPTTLSLIARWRILDNLRRSLLAPSLLVFLVVATMWFPGSPVLWTVLVLLVPATPGLTDLTGRLVSSGWPTALLPEIGGLGRALRSAAGFWFFEVTFLAHQAAVLCDAIGRTLWRLYVSHQHLLEWTSAAHAARDLAGAQARQLVWREMAAAPLTAAVIAIALAVARPANLQVTAPLLILWLLSPEIAIRISRSPARHTYQLSPEETQRLRALARRTWAFFETFVGPEDQWLPPDHFQEDPRGVVARRTSPTNIGLLQLATISAYDLGYGGLLRVCLRLKNTFDTLERMERHRGHFLNWYDTATLEPLLPRYVSTVDSGNLVACLLAVKQSCIELVDRPVIGVAAWDGFLDTLNVLDAVIDQAARVTGPRHWGPAKEQLAHLNAAVAGCGPRPLAWCGAVTALQESCPQLEQQLSHAVQSQAQQLPAQLLTELRFWSGQVHRHLERMQSEIDLFLPWLRALSDPPTFFTVADVPPEISQAWTAVRASFPAVPKLVELAPACATTVSLLSELDNQLARSADGDAVTAARSWIVNLTAGLHAAQQTAQYALERFEDIRQRAESIVEQTEFGLLYDRRRRLFNIGYNVTAARLDENHYDLLASEARLASFVAIAKGDVPEEHWLHLGRPVGRVDGFRALLSWSGTMFEYLMPVLLLRERRGTLIGESCAAAVAEQIAYAARRGVPWGISESGYCRLDPQQSYRYRAFGVPTLGFKRGLEDELVVAPYASLLALPFEPSSVLSNLAALDRLGIAGRYGFYEAVDFTWSHLPPGQRYGVVRSFMAHHQGMILAALNNFLNNGVLIQRFHADPVAHTAELLLFEQPARRLPLEQTRPLPRPRQTSTPRRVSMTAWPAAGNAPVPQAHVLSNGRYCLLATDGGGVDSWWGKQALTRCDRDATLDTGGFRIYLRDPKRGRVFGPFQRPSATNVTSGALFHPHMVELQVRSEDVVVRESITVAPNADVEIHLLTLSNEGSRRRRLVITSYGEVALDDAAASRKHPAFSKLFVESEYLPARHALLFQRRLRSPRDEPAYLVHMVVLPRSGAMSIGYETSRQHFLGRPGDPQSPAALADMPPRLSGTTGATLDPVMALSAEVDLPPHRTRQIAFVTLVAESRQAALALADSHTSLPHLEWTFELARNRSEVELARLRLDPRQLPAVEHVLSLLLYPHHARRASPDILEHNTLGRSGLWKFAISGDLPILLLRIHDPENMPLLHEVLRAQAFWRGRGISVDLVILSEQASSYSAELDDRVLRALTGAGADGWLNRPGGIFLVHADQLADADRRVLMTAARVILDGAGGSLAEQVAWPDEAAPLPPLVPTLTVDERIDQLDTTNDLLFDNGLGGFTPDGKEYVIRLDHGVATPAPWTNVVANSQFGSVISESGGGYSWAGNSAENRLTPWRNDPVCDTPGEVLYLRDEETAAVWSATPLPAGAAGTYEIRHGAGYTIFRHASHGVELELTLFVPLTDPVKVIRLTLTNRSAHPRRLTATYYVEWVLGTIRDVTQAFVIPSFDTASETLLAHNPWNEEFGEAVAFLAGGHKVHGFTTDRAEFLGRHGERARPAALTRIGLANAVHPGGDPCAALQLHVDLAAEETRTVHFLLGQGRNREHALSLAQQYRPSAAVESAWNEVVEHWDRTLGAATVHTPDPAFDVMLNRWLLYQTLCCRVWARTGFYQSSGAYGFRDQLQDVAALVHAAPDVCRAHLLECARHQFEEGDVLHWWHPPSSAGIRTRCSDDLLWLPYVTAHYVQATGDRQVLSEELPFLHAEPLRPDEKDRYGRFARSERVVTLYQHCLRAIERGQTAGAHGLPLFGSGDWNDGMDRVGAAGRGESVWVGWFLYATLISFAPLCRLMEDAAQADQLLGQAERLRTALDASAWDGNWYRRGYYDDGRPLGSATQDECRIDSVAQSWAALSGAGEREHVRSALNAVRQQLVLEREGLMLLLAPPFASSLQDPGYIKAYPPGIRENGGQYTHAAVWVLWALVEIGEVDLAARLFKQLLPVGRAATAGAAAQYRVEPYVLAADVYSLQPHTGRGGWTWYTGSAGWAYRFGWEKILGLRLEQGAWRVDPHIPRNWHGFDVRLRDGATTYEIHVENPRGEAHGIERMSLDGVRLDTTLLPRLSDGVVHQVQIVLA